MTIVLGQNSITPPPFRISRSHCYYLKTFFLEINFNILKQRMVNLNLRNLLHACNLFCLNKKKQTKNKDDKTWNEVAIIQGSKL